jgi:hypothetical protein
MKFQSLFLLAVTLFSGTQIMAAPVAVEQIDLTSPEATVRSYVGSINSYDLDAAAAHIVGATPVSAEVRTRMAAGMAEARKEKMLFAIEDLKSNVRGDRATVTLTLKFIAQNHPVGDASAERLPLQKIKGAWKIIPGDAATSLQFLQPKSTNVLWQSTTRLMDAKFFGMALEKERERLCGSNANQIYTALMALSNDEGKLALKASTFKNDLGGYYTNTAMFICPGDKKALEAYMASTTCCGSETSYAFNERFEGATLDNVATPDVVLFYEGANKVLHYRHHNRAHVVFANGVVKLIDRKQAQTLRW